jgi:hypothetical protein
MGLGIFVRKQSPCKLRDEFLEHRPGCVQPIPFLDRTVLLPSQLGSAWSSAFIARSSSSFSSRSSRGFCILIAFCRLRAFCRAACSCSLTCLSTSVSRARATWCRSASNLCLSSLSTLVSLWRLLFACCARLFFFLRIEPPSLIFFPSNLYSLSLCSFNLFSFVDGCSIALRSLSFLFFSYFSSSVNGLRVRVPW